MDFPKTRALPTLAIIAGEEPLRPTWWGLIPLPGTDDLNRTAQLTRRERAIIGLIGEGLSYEEIGRRLRVDTHTLKSTVREILGKLGFRTRLEIAAYARRNGSRCAKAP